MTISPIEATEALRSAQTAARRSTTALNYRRLGDNLVWWGVIWAAVNIGGVLRLPDGTYLWNGCMLLGVAGSVALAIRAASRGERLRAAGAALMRAIALTLLLFGLVAVIPQPSLVSVELLLTLALGAAYMVLGTRTGWRLSAIGAALMATVIAGRLLAPDQTFAWLAVAGGGGLVLGGGWLRSA